MKLINFSVTNFRSITKANKLPLGDFNVLIGKNNEGKSNLLKALNIAMNALKEHAYEIQRGFARGSAAYERRRIRDEGGYDWERDFPINLQEKKPENPSTFRLEFALSDPEISDFRQTIKSNLNGSLPLEITIGRIGTPKFQVMKKGPGGNTLSKKSAAIARFIATKIDFNYIPAIRTDNDALEVVRRMLAFELRSLEREPAYREALATLRKLQKPVLDDLGQQIKKSLKQFIPEIRTVDVQVPDSRIRFALERECEVIIDDGTPTKIEFKGDGVKSLAALALLKNRRATNAASIVAIEEPESHLHPGAVHQLKKIIREIAAQNQVIISTHNPLFVERSDPASNIIIDTGKANPAKTIKDIRATLGVRASDNLLSARKVLVVEGDSDQTCLKALLATKSALLKKRIDDNELIIETIKGAGKLAYQLHLYSIALCDVHIVLDNDEAGRTAFENAKKSDLINEKNVTMINCLGMKNSELEDLFDYTIYENDLATRFGVSLNVSEFQRASSKWSDRIRAVFEKQGKPWSNEIENEAKILVARAVSKSPTSAVLSRNLGLIDSLTRTLELELKQ